MKTTVICTVITWFLLCVQTSTAQLKVKLAQQDFFRNSLQNESLFSANVTRSLIENGNENASVGERKNVGLAVFYSMLLPGMGELYAGDYSLGKYNTIAEAALWIGYTGFQLYGDWLQTDARNFAVQHANVNIANKSDQYFVDIGNFLNVYSYNTEMFRERQSYKAYNPLSSSYWNWDTDGNRESYRQLRVKSDETFNNSRFVLAAVLANHVISAVHAAQLIISHNSDIDKTSGLDIRARVIGGITEANGVMISVTKTF